MSARNNHLAYGYSIAITAAFAMLEHTAGSANVLHIFMFVTGPSIGFAATNATVTRGYRERAQQEPPLVLAMATSFGLLSISGSTAIAGVIGWLLGGWAAWLLGSLLATLAYLMISAAEAAIARSVHQSVGTGALDDET